MIYLVIHSIRKIAAVQISKLKMKESIYYSQFEIVVWANDINLIICPNLVIIHGNVHVFNYSQIVYTKNDAEFIFLNIFIYEGHKKCNLHFFFALKYTNGSSDSY